MEFPDLFAFIGAAFVVTISVALVVGMTLMDRAGHQEAEAEDA